MGGISALSGDPSADIMADGFSVSQYAPENGLALNLFAGTHLHEYVTLQGNYIWNRNGLALFMGVASPGDLAFNRQQRMSAQHAVVGDLLVYFRQRSSRLRPYLSFGLGVVRFDTDTPGAVLESAMPELPGPVPSTDLVLRVAVGMDIKMGDAWRLRYSSAKGSDPTRSAARSTHPGRAR